ncbi:MAG TPA: hypothetical protein VHY34_12430 [Caulobacteraceae bacterium]|jgi:hypothetical protein|nr:hypothetical protein [Caulobacteraceae bacterium]
MSVAVYDYVAFELPAGRAAWDSLRGQMRTAVVPAVRAAAGQVLGVFFPQLGFAANEGALLVRWPEEAAADKASIDVPGATVRSRDQLRATLRPGDADAPKPGGIYVHRWFTVAPANVETFVGLSGQAWPSFEAGFDSNIFGLFRADAPAANGDARMLLLTRYADHGVWEASRQPAPTAREAFGSRHELTTSTIARSSILLSLD